MGGVQYTGFLIVICFCVLQIFTCGAANVTVGSTCKANGDCSPIPNAVCNTTCQCSPHYFVPSSNKAKCLAKIVVNTVCNAKDKHQCSDINAECKNSNGTKCLCKDAYYWNATACTTRIQVNANCVPGKKGCIQNAICKTNKCQCEVGYTYRNKYCSGVSKIAIEISTIILALLALRCSKWFVE